jgi:peptidoglycan-associated lipoprotein
MKLRFFLMPIIAASLIVSGCGQDPPPPQAPAPAEDTDDEARRQAELERQRQLEEERRRREAEARERAIEEARSALTAMVFFEYDQSDLTPEAQRILRDKVDVLRANPAVRLTIEGHADERGSNEYNLALGQRRAGSVLSYFTSLGLDGARFRTISYGEERPLNPASNEMAWSRNRRAAFVITAGEASIQPVGP